MDQGSDVTTLLRQWKDGDRDALGRATALIYDELHRVADRELRREAPDHSVQATALVNDCWEKLAGQRGSEVKDRHHFVALAAGVMRRLLVDRARARRAEKRGGGRERIDLNETIEPVADRSKDLVDLDLALRELAARDPRAAALVELRWFGGLGIEEAAGLLGISVPTANRDWVAARAWLLRELSRDPAGDGQAPHA